jgi:hypothetical protein
MTDIDVNARLAAASPVETLQRDDLIRECGRLRAELERVYGDLATRGNEVMSLRRVARTYEVERDEAHAEIARLQSHIVRTRPPMATAWRDAADWVQHKYPKAAEIAHGLRERAHEVETPQYPWKHSLECGVTFGSGRVCELGSIGCETRHEGQPILPADGEQKTSEAIEAQGERLKASLKKATDAMLEAVGVAIPRAPMAKHQSWCRFPAGPCECGSP